MKMTYRAAALIWRWRFWLAASCVLLSLFAGVKLQQLTVSNSLELWYPQNHPELVRYREFQQTYGSDEIIVAVISDPEGFAGESGLDTVATITDSLFDVAGVATVTSLVTVPESLTKARGRLLSADRQTTAFVLQLMLGPEFESRRHALLADVKDVFHRHDYDARLAGFGVVFDALHLISAESRGGAA